MRKPRAIQAHERILLGDSAIAKPLGDALAIDVFDDRYTHLFHTYPAGLNPDTAKALLELFPGNSVYDPFCGGGTVLVEGRVAGRKTFGTDLSRTAIRTALARTSTASEETLTKARSLARKLAERARKATEMPPEHILEPLRDWYAPYVLTELESIRLGILEADPEIRPLLEACFSSILVKTSWRKSDTSAQRQKHNRPTGTAAILFHKKVRELGRRIAALREVVPEGTPESQIALQDARKPFIGGTVDLVLTSPPYPGTYDYVALQHLRHVWFEERDNNVYDELGSRKSWREKSRQARRAWVEGTDAWTASAAKALKPGGILCVVIGDGITPTGPIDSSAPTDEAARKVGLHAVARASIERVDHARNTSRWEHVLTFKKV